MNKLISLLKASMAGGVQLFNYRGKTERSRRLMPIILGLLIGALMLFSALAMTVELNADNNATAILSLYTLVTTIIIVMEGSWRCCIINNQERQLLLFCIINSLIHILVVQFY